MAIYFTGDTHRDYDLDKLDPEWNEDITKLTEDDTLIVLGDFGAVWYGPKKDDPILDWYQQQPYTTLFVPGNHENYELLDKYPATMYCGGLVRELRPKVMMLMRGEIYTIEGETLFAMGGAQSHDMMYRIPGISWWAGEMPSDADYSHAEARLEEAGWKVDYVLTHCAPDTIQSKLDIHGGLYEHDKLTNFLEHVVKEKCVYKLWLFGHYHLDCFVDEKHVCLYNKIITSDFIIRQIEDRKSEIGNRICLIH